MPRRAPVALPQFANWLSRENDTSRDSTRPRILLLTQAFPPHTAIGAARWEGFAPFLAEAGFGLGVVIEDPAAVANPDWDRFNQLPPDVRVAACTRRRPEWYQWLRRLRGAKPISVKKVDDVNTVAVSEGASMRVRAGSLARHAMNVTVRAQQSRVLVREFAQAATAMMDGRQRIIVSSGPSHYVHVAAANVARKHNIPYVIDLRDPWMRVSSHPLLERLLPDEDLRRQEATTLRGAALIITNTEAAGTVLGQRFPELRARIRSIPNGSDIVPLPVPAIPPPVFQIAHAGTLYLDRDPRPFLRAVARVRTKRGLEASELRVVFMGPPARIGGQTLTELATDAGIGDMFEERALGTREEARELMRESMMAVAFQGATTTQVPAKIFEYVAFPLWLLALVGSDSATADMLSGSSALVFNIDDEDATAQAIEQSYLQYREGVMPLPVGQDGRYSRQRQAERLIEELKRLTGVK